SWRRRNAAASHSDPRGNAAVARSLVPVRGTNPPTIHDPRRRANAVKDRIVIRNARQHNLKGIDLELPRRALVVLTGPSGSGKSSLAFDTIYAEGQRRYVESLSTYAKQFLERMEKPHVDVVEGISPAVAIEQKNPTKTSRS